MDTRHGDSNARRGGHGRGGGSGGARPLKPPTGFVPIWSAIGAGALAILAYQLAHQSGTEQLRAGPHPNVTVTTHTPALPAGAPSAGRAGVSPNELPAAARRPSPSARGPAPGSPTTSRPQPTPARSEPPTGTPSPSEPPPSAPLPLTVTATATVPVRNTTLLAARTAIVVPGAPPFPAGISADLALLGLKATIALP